MFRRDHLDGTGPAPRAANASLERKWFVNDPCGTPAARDDVADGSPRSTHCSRKTLEPDVDQLVAVRRFRHERSLGRFAGTAAGVADAVCSPAVPLAKVQSFVLVGIDAVRCEVEADVSQRGLSKVTLVGLAQSAVKESVERVRRAMINGGFPFPLHAVLINLAPADVKKEGPSLDLPIAIGLLRATNAIKDDRHRDYLIAGELALDGRLRRIKGALVAGPAGEGT